MHQNMAQSRISGVENNWKKCLTCLTDSQAPAGLEEKICARIAQAERRQARTRFVVYTSLTALFCAALFPVIRYAAGEFARSGFYEYLSLAFSDSGTVLTSWKEFALSLAESLPVLAVTLTLSTLFGFLGSLALAIKNTRTKVLRFA